MRIVLLAHARSIHTATFARRLRDEGAEVTVLSLTGGSIEGIPVVGLYPRWKWRYPLLIPAVRRHVRRLRPDVVYGMYAISNGMLAVAAGAPVSVVGVMGSDVVQGARSPLRRALLRRILSRATLVHAVADHLAELAVSLGAAPERVLSMPRGIDLGGARPVEGRDELSVVCTRHLEPVYDPGTVLRGFALARRRQPALRLELVGGGSLEAPLRALALQLGLGDSVRFRGARPQGEVWAALASSGLYLSASLADGTSASLLEAMAAGGFPVVSDIAANRERIEDGRNGILFPAGDPEALAGALLRALSDPALRERGREANRAWVARHADGRANVRRLLARIRECGGHEAPSSPGAGVHAVSRAGT